MEIRQNLLPPYVDQGLYRPTSSTFPGTIVWERYRHTHTQTHKQLLVCGLIAIGILTRRPWGGGEKRGFLGLQHQMSSLRED
ncbi:MAG: hypothetical protein GY820_28860 [Gammaproteobacteria bacterium]|nr:hypothetical protein [Gammaproteobacteria bacterium]